jgi:hypothetical protein
MYVCSGVSESVVGCESMDMSSGRSVYVYLDGV